MVFDERWIFAGMARLAYLGDHFKSNPGQVTGIAVQEDHVIIKLVPAQTEAGHRVIVKLKSSPGRIEIPALVVWMANPTFFYVWDPGMGTRVILKLFNDGLMAANT
jgi:hypothetical protein